jgi:AcrR family transcriptional regulator
MSTINGLRRRRGRPKTESAASHDVIMEAVYRLLQEKSARDMSMEEVARRAGVGKQTLYKWWPSKAALVMAMFSERIARFPDAVDGLNAEQVLRQRMRRLVTAFTGPLGKIVADLIAEGQSENEVLQDFYEHHVRLRREETIASVERGKASGELRSDVDADLLLDALFGAIYYRLLFRSAPLTDQYADALVSQAFRGLRGDVGGARRPEAKLV